MDHQVIDGMNRKLVETFGRELDGRPRFRLVFSTKQTETRFGEFHEFSGPIFLRMVKGFKEVLKYPYAPDRWILEKLLYYDNLEMPQARNGTYEPIWIFQDKEGNALDPVWPAVQLLIYYLLNPKETIKNMSQRKEDEEKQKKAEADEAYAMISNQSLLHYDLKHGGAVFCDSTKVKGAENDGNNSFNGTLSDEGRDS